jgi:hypothetical protein
MEKFNYELNDFKILIGLGSFKCSISHVSAFVRCFKVPVGR